MRKLSIMSQVSFDGCYEGPGEGWQTIDWHRVDDEWDRLSVDTLRSTGTVLFGRRTFEGFASFWPTQHTEIARLLTAIDKAVVSRTLQQPGWNNARLLRGDLRADIEALKAEPGGPILVYGSGTLVQSLTELGLVDEYVLAIVPVALGTGKPLFRPGAPRLNLELAETKIFATGVIFATYRPA
ncbi:MAG: dihydrofolate reductase family protein [Devosia sp.]|nr:dihydrofolate reductase family protein [Devosia sp.]